MLVGELNQYMCCRKAGHFVKNIYLEEYFFMQMNIIH